MQLFTGKGEEKVGLVLGLIDPFFQADGTVAGNLAADIMTVPPSPTEFRRRVETVPGDFAVLSSVFDTSCAALFLMSSVGNV